MDRERITISIKKNILGYVDKTIDKVNIRNRSHAIEHLIMKGLARTNDKNAVILLGGKDAMKSLPSAASTLKELQKSGFEKVYIAVGYLANKIEAKLGDGSQFGIEIEYLTSEEGSAGALIALKKIFSSTFFVFENPNGSEPDLEAMLEYHKQHNAVATISLDQHGSTGLYIFEPAIFRLIPKGFSMLEEDIFPKLSQKGDIVGYLQF